MASDIQTHLNRILNTVYGRDVRSSIHDAIELCYDDVTSGKTIAETAAESVTEAKNAAATATTIAAAAATNANNAATTATNAANDATNAASSANSAASGANTAAANANSAANAANDAVSDATDALEAINDAIDAVNDAIATIDAIDVDADEAASIIAAAQSATTAANSAAASATSAATAANNAADNANTKASSAESAANACTTAITSANLAASNANSARDAANTATTNANSARDSANTAATNANNAATSATTAATNANTAATNANAKITAMDNKMFDAEAATNAANSAASSANIAANNANTAADLIEGLTVDAEDVGPSTPASVTIDTVDGHINIHFVLRQGRSGSSFIIKGNAYETVEDLEEDIQNPEVGDQYNVGASAPYHIYRWTGTVWEDQGSISSNSDPITAQDVQDIQNGREIEDSSSKVMKVEALNYLINTLLVDLLSRKVDAIDGKGLSTNDYTNSDKASLTDLIDMVASLTNTKVDKVAGKGLSSNDFTTSMMNKVALIGDDALNTTSETITEAINELNDGKVSAASPTLTGTPRSTTPETSDDSTRIATTAYVQANLEAKKNLFYNNVSATSWTKQSSPTYTGYDYRCSISLQGVTSTMFALAVFTPDQVSSGNYAPVCITYDGGVYIYSKTSLSITVPTIAVFR